MHNIISDTESVQGVVKSADTVLLQEWQITWFDRENNLNVSLPFFHAGSFSEHEFQAETKKLLDIVARSLYSEKEVRVLICDRNSPAS